MCLCIYIWLVGICLKLTNVRVRWRTVTGVMLLLHPKAIQAHFTYRVRFGLLHVNIIVLPFSHTAHKSCGSLLAAPKNEDAYEISIPYEENSFEQQGFFNQPDQNFDGECRIKYCIKKSQSSDSLFILLMCSMFHDLSNSPCHPQSHPQMLGHLQ